MVKKREPDIINEWSHFVAVDDLGEGGVHVTISPNDAQKADLARRLDIVAVQSIVADLDVSPSKGGVIHVTGGFTAKIEQSCVVTLEPLYNVIEERVDAWFSDHDQMVSFAKVKKDQQVRKAHAEVELLDEAEDPEKVVNGQIDLGELVTQHLSLAVDPYPHKEGAVHEFTDENNKAADKTSPVRRNPFEALKDWKEKR